MPPYQISFGSAFVQISHFNLYRICVKIYEIKITISDISEPFECACFIISGACIKGRWLFVVYGQKIIVRWGDHTNFELVKLNPVKYQLS